MITLYPNKCENLLDPGIATQVLEDNKRKTAMLQRHQKEREAAEKAYKSESAERNRVCPTPDYMCIFVFIQPLQHVKQYVDSISLRSTLTLFLGAALLGETFVFENIDAQFSAFSVNSYGMRSCMNSTKA